MEVKKSLWNANAVDYRNRIKKKREYDELLIILSDKVSIVNYAALKGVVCCGLMEMLQSDWLHYSTCNSREISSNGKKSNKTKNQS